MAFIVAGLVFVVTLIVSALAMFAAGMSDVPNADSGASTIFICGTIIAVLVAATHWLPHISW